MIATYFRNPGLNSKISLAGFPTAPKIFLAEGDAEGFFLEALFRDRDYPPDQYAVFCYGGNRRLGIALKTLQGELLFPDVNALGIMTDADTKSSGTRDSVMNHCRKIRYIGPRTILRSGFASFQRRKLGVFVSPGGGRRGRIETLIKMEVAGEPENPCIEAFSDCLADTTGQTLSEKAIAQAFITSRIDSLCGVGRAFEAGVFDINNAAYEDAVNIFTNL